MNYGLGASLYRIEGLADDMLSCLGKYLDGDIIGDHILLDKRPDELEFGIG